MKYYYIDLSKYNIPTILSLLTGYGTYSILTYSNDVINAFLRLK